MTGPGTPAVQILRAILAGARYPPDGIPATPENRALWDKITADVAAMATAHVIPDIPAD
jgi:hypothetical protein